MNKVGLKKAFQASECHSETLCWNETLAGWTAIGQIPGLLDFLSFKPPVMTPSVLKPANPTPAPAPVAASGGGDLFAAIAARRAKNENPDTAASSMSLQTNNNNNNNNKSDSASPSSLFGAKRNSPVNETKSEVRTEQPKKITKALPKKENQLKPGEAEGWNELFTPEGVPYYFNKNTRETTWDKPDCMKSSDEFDRDGDWVWMPHDDWGFLPARRLTGYNDGKIHLETEDGQHHAIPGKTELDTISWSSLRREVSDLVMLDDMSLPLILRSLQTRFEKNEIYTNVGTILISINPYKRLPLYTPTIISKYRTRGTKNIAPHVYLIADQAFNNLLEFKQPQSIVISGESGAGKTECTKQALQYLAEVAGSSTSNVEQRILATNPILEAFGNAKTVRNNNSSRFGKYVEIFFDKRYQISGATNTNYLLEKIRVVKQSKNERNFHAFYMLCRGADASTKTRLKLQNVSDYFYLSQSGCDTVDDMDDKLEFEDVIKAMKDLDWSQPEMDNVWTTIAGILNIGNIKFTKVGDRKCAVTNKGAVDTATQLLQLDTTTFHKAVTTRVMRVPGQADIDVSLGKEEAEAARDALAKFVYEKLFDWIVIRVNKSIGVTDKSLAAKNFNISILDIFGFEIFEHNLFEQLCINYTNEKLQQFFNQHTFKKEEEVYRFEGINFDHVHYIDNQPILDLIDARPNGILPCVDEEIRMPKGSDKTFIQKLVSAQGKSNYFKSYLKNPDMFVVEHYAGTVVYDSNGFLEKNRDQLNEDAYSVLIKSQFSFLSNLFVEESGNKKATLGTKFSKQLTDLMIALNATEPHYIRCVKPNPNKAAMEFHPVLVLEQLRYSGVFEAVKIRKQGFPFRYTHAEFVKRFKCIVSPKTVFRDFKADCKMLIETMKEDLTKVQIGKSRVLYRAEQHRTMELIRNVAVEATTVRIQQNIRGWLARKLKKRLLAARPKLQSAMATRTLEALDKCFAELPRLGFELYEFTRAKRLRYVITEEIRIEKLLSDLLRQDPERVFEDLSKAIASADEVEYNSDTARKARITLEEIKDRRKARAWLKEGVDEADEEKLRWAVAVVKRLNMSVGSELHAAEAMIERIEKEKQLIAQMETALSRNGFLREGDSINPSEIRQVNDSVRSFGPKTTNGIAMHKKTDLICRTRETLKAAQGTKDKTLWRAVRDVVSSASDGLENEPEVQKALEEVSHQAAVDDVAEALDIAVRQLDQAALTFNLDQAARLRVDEHKYTIVPTAREYLARIVEARSLMDNASAVVEEQQLIYAVQYSESFGYDTQQVTDCRTLRDLVMTINIEAVYALDLLEEEPMRDLITRADAIRLDTPDIQQLKTWIFDTSEEKFVQQQLKQAVKHQDNPRRIRLTIKLKDIFFKKSGPMFVFENYAKLIPPQDWADMKIITFNREKLAASTRNHTIDPIHHCLTEPGEDNKRNNIARNMFKNLMGFMGDKSNYGPPLPLGVELITNCLIDPWLRDEVYCQIVKQITNNPNEDSKQKGWHLMACCLETFPPQSELENHLEMWLRTHAKPADRFVRLLHTVVYGGARSAPLTEMEVQNVMSGKSLRQMDFDTKRPYAPPAAAIPPKGQGPVYYQKYLSQGGAPAGPAQAAPASFSPAQAVPASYPAHAAPASYGAPPGFGTPAPASYGSVAPPPEPTPAAAWSPPAQDIPMPPPPADEMPPPPPPGAEPKWLPAYDNGQLYYYNVETLETSWTNPEA